ncbi:hypothetical protein ABPG75_011009 [Micractinium tetrahymenae]
MPSPPRCDAAAAGCGAESRGSRHLSRTRVRHQDRALADTMQALSSRCVAGAQSRQSPPIAARQRCGAAPFAAATSRRPGLSSRSGSGSRLQRTVARPASHRRSQPTRALKQVERYTHDSVAAVKKAQSEASKLGKNFVGPEHLLLGLLAVSAEDKGIAARVLEARGVQLKPARKAVEAVTGVSGQGLVQQIVELPLSGKADAVLGAARREAVKMGVPDAIGTQHVLLALLAEEQGPTKRVLARLGIEDHAGITAELEELTYAETAARRPGTEKKQAALNPALLAVFLPLAALPVVLQLPRALACVAAAAALCAAALFTKHRQPKGGAAAPLLRSAAVAALAGAAGWFGGRAATAAVSGFDPRLAAVAHCCAAVLALGLGAAVA